MYTGRAETQQKQIIINHCFRSTMSPDTIKTFASCIGADVTVMKDGEHWFHTEEQMEFLDNWVKRIQKAVIQPK